MTAQVLKFQSNEVYEDIMGFINLGHHSQNTKIAYEKAIRDFFRVMKKKEIEHLKVDDLEIKKKDVEGFRTILQNEGLSNATINNKVAGLRKLYIELVANEYKINVEFFKAIKKLKEDVDSYDPFTVEEVFKLSETVKKDKSKGKNKSLFILFLLDTCIRKTAALNLKWSDFQVLDDKEVKLNVIDKGNKYFKTKISKEFYEELLEIKTNDEKVFGLTLAQVDKMLPRLLDKLDINDNRNLAIHSIRKTGITFKYRYTGDIKVAQRAANHTDASLTIKTYIDSEDYGVLGAVSIQHNDEENYLDKLNLTQLRKVLESLDQHTLLKINKKAKEIYGNNADN